MKLLRRIQYWLNQRRAAAELAEEIESHRLMRQEQLQQSGMSNQEASAASKRAMGNALLAAEQARDVWIWLWLDQLVRDMRIGARTLMKVPGFTVFATLILSVGIGAMVTVFAYSNSIFFKAFHIPNSASFVRVYAMEGVSGPVGRINYSNYEQYRDRNHSLAAIGMLDANAAQFPLRLNGPGTRPVDIVQSSFVSGGLFKAIGVSMVLGRGIEAEDQWTGAPSVVVLNEVAWRRYFAGDPTILNRIVYLNNTAYTIVGVAPKSFEDAVSWFPTPPTPQVFLAVRDNARPGRAVEVAGRLKPGISRTEAQADFSRLATQISLEQNSPAGVSVERADLPPSWLRSRLAVLVAFFFVVVCTVLLIACDDIAIMLLARILARRREMGIRVALGGSRLQLIRQLLAENLLLSILGGVGAMIIILLSSRVIESLPIPLPGISRAVFDWRVLTFTIFASLSTTLFFGLRPALECVNRDVAASLSPVSSQRQGRVRSNLVVAQIAVCTAMLITAAVVTRSVSRQALRDPGYETEHIWLNDVDFVGASYSPDSQLAFYRQLAPRLMTAPGIASVSIRSNHYTRADSVKTVAGGVLQVLVSSIDERYFRTLQVPLVLGRGFSERDSLNSEPIGIINQKMAAALFGKQSPIGQIVRTGEASVEIVGVVRDVLNSPFATSATPTLYRPLYQLQTTVSGTVTVMMKVSETAAANQILRDTVSELDSSLFVYRGRTMDDESWLFLLPTRIVGYVIGIPGVFALLLGIIGTYGTMATLVAQRRREVGIRIALGARPSIAIRAILRDGIRSVFVGVGFGIAAVVIIFLWLRRNIGEAEFFDPMAFAIVIFAVITTAGTACYIPAKRASRVDPMIVLREE